MGKPMVSTPCVQASETITMWQTNGAITMCASKWCPHNLPPRGGTAQVPSWLPSCCLASTRAHLLATVCHRCPLVYSPLLLAVVVVVFWACMHGLWGSRRCRKNFPLSHSVHNHKCISQCGARHWSQMSTARLGHPLFAQLIRLSSGSISVATVSSSSL